MDSERLSTTFVELADTLVADFDVIDFLHLLTDRCVELLDVTAAGVLLADPRRTTCAWWRPPANRSRLLELFQLQNDEGPCLDCFRTGRPVTVDRPGRGRARAGPGSPAPPASRVRRGARRCRCGCATQVIGALNLFRAAPGPLDPADLRIAQALADVATIGILQQRARTASPTPWSSNCRRALNSRVLIEQAKGMLAERLRHRHGAGVHHPARLRPGEPPAPLGACPGNRGGQAGRHRLVRTPAEETVLRLNPSPAQPPTANGTA